MKVLVTGHQGYIGAVLVPLLLEEGHDVVGYDTGYFNACDFLPPLAEVEEIRKDIRKVEKADLKGFDAIIHLAALSNDPMGNLNPQVTYSINHKGTVNLAKLAREAGVRRFLFSSSCSTYGAGGDGFLDEEAAFNPVTPYGESKVKSELEIKELVTPDFCPVFLRNATAYGLSPRIRFDLVLNNLTAWAATTGKIMMKSDGSPWRPIVHIGDISRAFIAFLKADEDRIRGRAYNVGRTSENYRVREIAQIVGEVVPDCEVAFADGASPDARDYRVSFERIEKEIPEFKPVWTARKGVEEVYKAIREQGLQLEEFEGRKYMRLAHLQEKIDSKLLNEDLYWA